MDELPSMVRFRAVPTQKRALTYSYTALPHSYHSLQELEEYESGMVQVYQKLVDVYNGEGWLSHDGTLLTTSIAETTPFADSGYCSPELAKVCTCEVC
jgi:hypothetical protein